MPDHRADKSHHLHLHFCADASYLDSTLPSRLSKKGLLFTFPLILRASALRRAQGGRRQSGTRVARRRNVALPACRRSAARQGKARSQAGPSRCLAHRPAPPPRLSRRGHARGPWSWSRRRRRRRRARAPPSGSASRAGAAVPSTARRSNRGGRGLVVPQVSVHGTNLRELPSAPQARSNVRGWSVHPARTARLRRGTTAAQHGSDCTCDTACAACELVKP